MATELDTKRAADILLENAMRQVDELSCDARISDECRLTLYAEYRRLSHERYGVSHDKCERRQDQD